MPNLSELYIENHTTLLRLSSTIETLLAEHYKNSWKGEPLYAVKARVKTFESIKNKIIAIKNSKESSSRALENRKKAERLLVDNDLQMGDLTSLIRDVVGARLVWYFRSAKVDSTRDLLSVPWLSISKVDTSSYGEVADIKVYCEKNEFDENYVPWLFESVHRREPAENKGYTSNQFFATLSEIKGRSWRIDVPFEIQVRTLLEECWSEVSHYLIYKGISEKATERIMIASKTHFGAIDKEYTEAHSEVRDKRRLRIHPVLQLSRHYPLRSGEVGENFVQQFERAHECLADGDFADARRIFIVLQEAIPKQVCIGSRGDLRDRVWRRITSDIAATYLYESRIGGREEARRLSASILKNKKHSFWGNLRMAEVERLSKRMSPALSYAERALSSIGEISICSTTGLVQDVEMYIAQLHWDAARVHYGKALKSVRHRRGKKIKKSTTRAGDMRMAYREHFLAIQLASKCYRALVGSIENRFVGPEAFIRAASGLLYFLTFRDDGMNLLIESRADKTMPIPDASEVFDVLERMEINTPLAKSHMAWAVACGVETGGRYRLERALELARESSQAMARHYPLLPDKISAGIERRRRMIEEAVRAGRFVSPLALFEKE